MNQKQVSLVFIVLIFSLVCVVAETDEETKTNIENYVNLQPDDTSTIATLNGMSEEQRSSFFTEIAAQTEIDSISKLTDQFKEFDSNGNVVLENGQKINLKSLYNYAKEANAGKGEFSYDFRGESFDSSSPRIKGFEVTDEGIKVSFENGASLSLDKDSNFDFENRQITVGEESIAWSNMNGEVAVTGEDISLGVLSDESGESDLKDFPIVQDNNGNVVSPYQEAVSNVKLPDGFEKPSKGKFKEFENGGKRYSVDSDGKVYEVKSSSLKLGKGSSVSEVSEGMIALKTTKSESGEQQTYGEFFTKESTAIIQDGEKPTDLKSNFIWAYEMDGKLSVSINSVGDGRLFYNQQTALEELELHGNVLVKNGDYFLESDSEGSINIREIKGEQSTFAFGIGKLGTGGEDYLTLKMYEGDDEALKGKLVLYRSDGQLAMGSGNIAQKPELASVKVHRDAGGSLHTGSGTVVGYDSQGYPLVLTAAHVLRDASGKITIELGDQTFNAELIASDDVDRKVDGKTIGLDLALVRITDKVDLPYVPVSRNLAQEKSQLLLVGYPHGGAMRSSTFTVSDCSGSSMTWCSPNDNQPGIQGQSGGGFFVQDGGQYKLVSVLTGSDNSQSIYTHQPVVHEFLEKAGYGFLIKILIVYERFLIILFLFP